MHILLIEDNPADARLVQEALIEAQLPARLNWMNTGAGALKFLRDVATLDPDAAPDLILLDLNLPGVHGKEILAEIKTDARLLHIPVIVLSSSAARSDVMDAYRAHANAYVTKPTEFSRFVSLVVSLVTHWAGSVLLPGRSATLHPQAAPRAGSAREPRP
jgi:chemotaxis family two-component system response regulator Rcp1